MKLPEEERAGAANVVMQGIEAAGGASHGLNGEKTTLADVKHFLFAGIPAITDATTKTAGGLNFLGKTLWEDSYTKEIPDRICIEVDYEALASKSEGLSAAAEETIRLGEQIQSYEKEMPFYMQGRNLVTFQLNQVASEVEHLGKKMQKLASLQQEIAACYQKADEQTEELCNR